ncbi:MAG: hypothetical protein JSV05_02300 [Candidatus Bathyarchaeota archaeon]|nr:MAG: hypothetical protein JSV05_02300 [Candidatus Bathyarchaeota archaeon]
MLPEDTCSVDKTGIIEIEKAKIREESKKPTSTLVRLLIGVPNYSIRMSSRKRRKSRKKKDKKVGIESIVEPGYGALYIRSSWMKKLRKVRKKKQKPRK